ncbi:MAG TPA: DUF3107 domain-containing protein [Acidimicrobiales bacterium]|nr:DUF3107 domain-containing protein [Acidimicrobiales bacterium]
MVVVRIGVTHAPREIEVEMAEDTDRTALGKSIDQALGTAGDGQGVLWLEDRRGRRVGVPAARVAYVEIGAPGDDRRVGFGAP